MASAEKDMVYLFFMSISVIVHLILSWGWVKGKTLHFLKKRWLFLHGSLAVMP